MMTCDAPLRDPYEVADTFVSGLADIERMECGCFRFTLYVEKRSIVSGLAARQVVARLVMAADDVSRSLERTMELLRGYPDDIGKPLMDTLN